jgi:hypothetical protein
MKYHIRYRSGKTLRAEGEFQLVSEPAASPLPLPVIIDLQNRAIILDPRAVITDEQGVVVYNGGRVTAKDMAT